MAILAATEKKEKETKPLSQVTSGNVVRFPNITFEKAIKSDDDGFFLVMGKEAEKDGRVCLIPLSGKGVFLYRDKDFTVYEHKIDIHVHK